MVRKMVMTAADKPVCPSPNGGWVWCKEPVIVVVEFDEPNDAPRPEDRMPKGE